MLQQLRVDSRQQAGCDQHQKGVMWHDCCDGRRPTRNRRAIAYHMQQEKYSNTECCCAYVYKCVRVLWQVCVCMLYWSLLLGGVLVCGNVNIAAALR